MTTEKLLNDLASTVSEIHDEGDKINVLLETVENRLNEARVGISVEVPIEDGKTLCYHRFRPSWKISLCHANGEENPCAGLSLRDRSLVATHIEELLEALLKRAGEILEGVRAARNTAEHTLEAE